MKRSGKKVATDRSFVVALSRGLDVLRAFQPNDGLLGNQEIAARTNLPKPTVSRLTYTLTKLGYLTPVPRFEKYQLAPSAMALGYAALANLGLRHLSEPFREEVMRATGGAVAVGGRDRAWRPCVAAALARTPGHDPPARHLRRFSARSISLAASRRARSCRLS